VCRASGGAVDRYLLLRGHHATQQRGNRSNKTHPQHHTHQERDEYGRRTRATLVSMRSVPFKLLRTSHMHAMVSFPMLDLYDDMRAKSSREDRGRLQLGTRFPLGRCSCSRRPQTCGVRGTLAPCTVQAQGG